MVTEMSERTPIMVMSGDQVLLRTTVDALRAAGWTALGTSDPWEAITLATQRSFSLIVRDGDLRGMGNDDFLFLLNEDPTLKDTPTLVIPREGTGGRMLQEDLLAAVDRELNPKLPPEVPTGRETRFVRRSRPTLAKAV